MRTAYGLVLAVAVKIVSTGCENLTRLSKPSWQLSIPMCCINIGQHSLGNMALLE